ncbi:MAG: DUF1559 domain-containing protein [Planctomycetaceae bacterium]|jgi:prepilin-type N-terminal cleavage/methylation domain-containing protein/prepilin-type processing-associated H-X9-DG protein|nr:DUF1559 domain-containing protein [Planctomycetaceae bacterium]
MKKTLRFGFTLVELLVVIAIIGALIALLLPAVQAAREAARRMSCTNKLKQLAIGTHNYHDVIGCFPPGAVSNSTADTLSTANLINGNWGIALLPYIEQQSVYDTYQSTKTPITNTSPTGVANGTPNNLAIAKTIMLPYVCPSDQYANLLVTPPSLSVTVITTSYRGIGGSMVSATDSAVSANEAGWHERFGLLTSYKKYRGIFHFVGTSSSYGSIGCENFSSILDGTSNCLLFTEHHNNQEYPARGTMWLGNPGCFISSVHRTSSILMQTHKIQPCIDAGFAQYVCAIGTGSWHSGGVNSALGDGSVRFTSFTTNVELWADYARIDSGVSKPGL